MRLLETGPLHKRITSHSFTNTSISYRTNKTSHKPKVPRKRRRSKSSVKCLTASQQQQHDDLSAKSSTNALLGVGLYIDKSVKNRDQLARIARMLSATVIEKWSTSATHLIYSSSGSTRCRHKQPQHSYTPYIIIKALEKKMRVVAPDWLLSCYDRKERLPETLFPYQMNYHHRVASLPYEMSWLSFEEEENGNPFELTAEEFGVVETPGNLDKGDTGDGYQDRKLTDFFQRISNGETDNYPQSGEKDNKNITIGKGKTLIGSNFGSVTHHEETSTPQFQQSGQRITDGTELAYLERIAQQADGMDRGEQQQRIYDDVGPTSGIDDLNVDDYGTCDERNTTSAITLPLPARHPKRVLGKEDRLQIWCGEQPLILDSGHQLSGKMAKLVYTTSSLPLVSSHKASTSAQNPAIEISSNWQKT
ncbi:hypothetical protein BCR42DRAFT_427729 [Absidia repens]|uniref:BRCT domain-containing protein n=1 Tax=Absidia repens TaxID=90262 RepID=A0A1X2HZ04_9FUNG|nr:hypothetical protein BCR42DRAFT_427729 [Absidia repens]